MFQAKDELRKEVENSNYLVVSLYISAFIWLGVATFINL